MPLYEYRCRRCGQAFEYLARAASDTPKGCPKCGAHNPVKQFSTFAARSEGGTSGSDASCPTGTCPTGTCSLT
ncbi:MAG: zinc ribbon domain-containing protein [Phycisphaerae bacterium]|nr:zinc ribbon domain-containing protein [Phycisphaerae bacterium]